jgi:two-component system response regulator
MQKSLLLVEDNEDDVFFLQVALKKAGLAHTLRVARNGREAIDTLREALEPAAVARPFDLMLLDLKMPYVSGIEVLEWAGGRPELRFLPIVVLTSSEQESDIETAYRLGAAAFLVKPSQPEALIDLVRAIDAFWLRQNRLPAAPIDRPGPARALAHGAS